MCTGGSEGGKKGPGPTLHFRVELARLEALLTMPSASAKMPSCSKAPEEPHGCREPEIPNSCAENPQQLSEKALVHSTQSTPETSSQNTAAAPRLVVDAAAAPLGQEQKRRQRRPSGIVTFYKHDGEAAALLEKQWPAEGIAAAVAEVKRRGKEPVPGLVEKVLEQRAAREQCAVREEAARAAREAQERRAEKERAAGGEGFRRFQTQWGRAG